MPLGQIVQRWLCAQIMRDDPTLLCCVRACALPLQAMGATIGGMLAQIIFLPMLGAGTLSALRHAGALLLRCLLRLMAAEACQPRGFRLLASGVRLLLQRRPVWRGRLAGALHRRRRLQPPADGEQGQAGAVAPAEA